MARQDEVGNGSATERLESREVIDRVSSKSRREIGRIRPQRLAKLGWVVRVGRQAHDHIAGDERLDASTLDEVANTSRSVSGVASAWTLTSPKTKVSPPLSSTSIADGCGKSFGM